MLVIGYSLLHVGVGAGEGEWERRGEENWGGKGDERIGQTSNNSCHECQSIYTLIANVSLLSPTYTRHQILTGTY